MRTVEVVKWAPTPELRWYSPDRRYVPERLERRFFCTASDGTTGHLWAEVHPENPFVRVDKTPNGEGETRRRRRASNSTDLLYGV